MFSEKYSRSSQGHLSYLLLTANYLKRNPNPNLKPVSSPSIQSSSWAEVVKKAKEERNYDKEAEKTVVKYYITDSDEIDASQSTGCIFEKKVPNEFIISANRMEKYGTAKSARAKPIEGKSGTGFDKRCVMANVKNLKGIPIFVKPKLCWKNRQNEKSLLGLRYNLVQQGFDKQIFRITNLTLVYYAVTVDPSQTLSKV